MKIYTAFWKYPFDDYYGEQNRKMFTTRELADAFLTDVMNYEHIEGYYVLEEDVHEEYSLIDAELMSDWECYYGTLHTHDDICTCDEYADGWSNNNNDDDDDEVHPLDRCNWD